MYIFSNSDIFVTCQKNIIRIVKDFNAIFDIKRNRADHLKILSCFKQNSFSFRFTKFYVKQEKEVIFTWGVWWRGSTNFQIGSRGGGIKKF